MILPNRVRENKIYLNGSYDLVECKNRERQKAYAMSNRILCGMHRSFFGENDFNPLKNDELKQHDPAMYATLEQLWPA